MWSQYLLAKCIKLFFTALSLIVHTPRRTVGPAPLLWAPRQQPGGPLCPHFQKEVTFDCVNTQTTLRRRPIFEKQQKRIPKNKHLIHKHSDHELNKYIIYVHTM